MAHDIVISYSSSDEAIASGLHATLATKGYAVWRDDMIVGGTQYDQEIAEAIAAAKAVLVLWSPTSVCSNYVVGEARDALRRGTVIPLLILGLSPNQQPYDFHTTQAIDFSTSSASDQTRTYAEIIAALAAKGVFPRGIPAGNERRHDPRQEITSPSHRVLDATVGLILGAVIGFLYCAVLAADIKPSGYFVAMCAVGASGCIVGVLAKRRTSVFAYAVLASIVLSASLYIIFDWPVQRSVILRISLILGTSVGLLIGAAGQLWHLNRNATSPMPRSDA